MAREQGNRFRWLCSLTLLIILTFPLPLTKFVGGFFMFREKEIVELLKSIDKKLGAMLTQQKAKRLKEIEKRRAEK